MSATADAVARVKAEMEQALGMMRTQMAAFRRLAGPEVMASYPRITAIVGRENFLVSGKRTKAGLKELLDESELLAWDVPHLLEELFTEAWMQQCFTANDTYPDTTAYRIYDYLRGRGRPESPFPAHFAETLHRAFHPLGRLLSRSGFDLGSDGRDESRAADDRALSDESGHDRRLHAFRPAGQAQPRAARTAEKARADPGGGAIPRPLGRDRGGAEKRTEGELRRRKEKGRIKNSDLEAFRAEAQKHRARSVSLLRAFAPLREPDRSS
jgi:hypothetical protein